MRYPSIDAERLARDLESLSRIGGRPDGSVTRLAFSDEDRAGRDHVARLVSELGLEPRIDAVGNLFAIRPGADPGAGVVFAGSHTDTVGSGGRFDGALGVLSAVAALRAVTAAGIVTRHPLGIVSFVNEEGVRYMTDMMGSLFVRGDLSIDEARALPGIDGTVLGDEMDRTRMAGPDSLRAVNVRGYVELHIEQGPVLEDSGTDIGIVDAVQGLRWLRCRFSGKSNHAGTTPMDRRHDATLAAARVVVEARRLTTELPGLRATVGQLRVEPGLVNVIAATSQCTLDLRHPDPERLADAERIMRDRIRRIAGDESLDVTVDDLATSPPVTFHPEIVATIERAVARRGLSGHRMISGAGHDAQIMARVWPTAMIFVPSCGGVSHSVDEYTEPGHCVAGAQVLLDTLLDLAEVVD